MNAMSGDCAEHFAHRFRGASTGTCQACGNLHGTCVQIQVHELLNLMILGWLDASKHCRLR